MHTLKQKMCEIGLSKRYEKMEHDLAQANLNNSNTLVLLQRCKKVLSAHEDLKNVFLVMEYENKDMT